MQKFVSFFYRQKEYIFLLLILCIAAYLRLWRISEYMTFLGDEGRDALVVKRMIVDHDFTLLGPTASVGGFYLGPIYYYLMLPFMWLWSLDPTGAAVMVALFGIATVLAVYLLSKEIFDEYAGYISASLYAVSPLVIAQSRSSWNPNIVPFFATVLVYLLWIIYKNRNTSLLFWVGLMLGIGIQLHYLFIFLYVLVVIWMLVLYRLDVIISVRNYLGGIAGLLIGASLFLLFELRHGFPNTQSIIKFILKGDDTGFIYNGFISNIYDIYIRLFSRLIIRLPDKGFLDILPHDQQILWLMVGNVIAIGVIVYYVSFIIRNFEYFRNIFFPNTDSKILSDKKNYIVGWILITLWCIIPLILFGFYKRSIYDYYFVIFFPWPFIMLGSIGSSLVKIKYIKYIIAIFWMSMIYWNWIGRPFVYRPNNQYSQMRQIADAAYKKAENKPFNFALVTGGNSDHVYRFFFEMWGNTPVVIQNPEVDPNRKSVTDQLIVVCETPCELLGHPLWEIAGFGKAIIASEEEVPFVKIYRLIHPNKE